MCLLLKKQLGLHCTKAVSMKTTTIKEKVWPMKENTSLMFSGPPEKKIILQARHSYPSGRQWFLSQKSRTYQTALGFKLFKLPRSNCQPAFQVGWAMPTGHYSLKKNPISTTWKNVYPPIQQGGKFQIAIVTQKQTGGIPLEIFKLINLKQISILSI